MKITTSAELVDKALKEIKTLTLDEAHSKMTEGKSNIIDIRDIRELQNEWKVQGATCKVQRAKCSMCVYG